MAAITRRRRNGCKVVRLISANIVVGSRRLLAILVSVLTLVEHPLVLLILVLSKCAALSALAHGTLVNELRHSEVSLRKYLK